MTMRDFDRLGYVVMPSVIGSEMRGFLAGYALRSVEGEAVTFDHLAPGVASVYAAPLMQKILISLVPAVEAACGRRVYPTYSFFRVYRTGDRLRKHTDREACEISLSVSLSCDTSMPWPLMIEGPAGVAPVGLGEGDGVLYKGIACRHWREPFAGERAAQVFFHYVDRDGPYAEHRLDARKQAEMAR